MRTITKSSLLNKQKEFGFGDMLWGYQTIYSWGLYFTDPFLFKCLLERHSAPSLENKNNFKRLGLSCDFLWPCQHQEGRHESPARSGKQPCPDEDSLLHLAAADFTSSTPQGS